MCVERGKGKKSAVSILNKLIKQRNVVQVFMLANETALWS